MPEISVIVPIYNTAQYLPNCIESILLQTYDSLELLLVDDGSTDDSWNICCKYAKLDNRIKLIHQENSGVAAARNAALDVASGRYIAFCDSDDSLDYEALNVLNGTMSKGNRDCVGMQYKKIDSDNTVIKETAFESCVLQGGVQKKRLYNCIFYYMHYKLGVEVCTKLFSGQIIRENHIRFCENSNNFAEDFGFMIKYLLYANNVEIIPFCGYNYYVRENSTMEKGKGLVRLNEINEISRDVADTLQDLMNEKQYERNRGLMHFLVMYNQYVKLSDGGQLRTLPHEIDKIENITWFQESTKLTIKYRKYLNLYLGKANADRIAMLSRFCLHKNWKRYCVESALYYRFCYKNAD